MAKTFQVGFTADFLDDQGQTTFKDLGTGLLDAQPGLDYSFVEKPTRPIQPESICDFDAIVSLAPHCIGWTEELFRDIGHMACQAVIDVSQGQIPASVVNREVLNQPGFQEKIGRWKR